MSSRSFLRFIHAANFRPGQVARGVGDCPDTLKRQLLDAPRQAATTVFDKAIEHSVDFVLLNGDMLPAAVEQTDTLTFLRRHFQRLGEHGIEIFWRMEQTSGDAWVSCYSWPENVHFVSDDDASFTYTRDGAEIASVNGGNNIRENVFSISLTNQESTHAVRSDYVALCGRVRTDAVDAGQTSHSPGVVQGLGFDEPGPHGCSLVELDDNDTLSISLLETAPVIWESLQISVSSSRNLRELLQNELRARSLGSLRLLNVLLDSSDSQVALDLETQNLTRLRSELQSAGSGQQWVVRLEVAAGMTVVEGAFGNTCVQDFRHLVHQAGDQCTASLRSQSALAGTSPQAQLLTDVSRLGTGLLT